MVIKSLLRLCVKRALEPFGNPGGCQVLQSFIYLFIFILLHIRKVEFYISSSFIFSVFVPSSVVPPLFCPHYHQIARGLFIMYTIVCSLTTWCYILSWTLTVKVRLDSVTSLCHLPKSLLLGLRCCLYLWLPASLGLSQPESAHFHWRPQPTGAEEDCFLARSELF